MKTLVQTRLASEYRHLGGHLLFGLVYVPAAPFTAFALVHLAGIGIVPVGIDGFSHCSSAAKIYTPSGEPPFLRVLWKLVCRLVWISTDKRLADTRRIAESTARSGRLLKPADD
jgi:hypothetical protein